MATWNSTHSTQPRVPESVKICAKVFAFWPQKILTLTFFGSFHTLPWILLCSFEIHLKLVRLCVHTLWCSSHWGQLSRLVQLAGVLGAVGRVVHICTVCITDTAEEGLNYSTAHNFTCHVELCTLHKCTHSRGNELGICSKLDLLLSTITTR